MSERTRTEAAGVAENASSNSIARNIGAEKTDLEKDELEKQISAIPKGGTGKTAIVAGATGLIGGELIGQLIADSRYNEVIALVRRPVSFPDSAKLRVVETDWSEEGLAGALQGSWGAADVFCALGTTRKKAGSRLQFRRVDLEYPLLLGRMAKRYGASRFAVVSAIGSDPGSLFFYSRVKGEMERELRSLSLPGLHIFRPSLLVGDRAEIRPGEKAGEAIASFTSFLLVGRLRAYRPIAAGDVARAMIAAAAEPDEGTRVHGYNDMMARQHPASML
ncbi:NAD(P)H-binding protein [Paenibacillus hodogayensis]|uniref:NAD(P)H-binding protein n=1 Tax=Paenibacillus hodogayensis TaxID=279208 RepID=A0ABV5VR95_9BACL